ncbi:AAA family ATPase [Campylobacter sp. W0014]|uniref:AAA family ATPase n=1 Tax=Campylobacter sp. W0014 TaxID=2735781 RepID=UPI001EBB012E|nr:AAA family ATPase [Campylobacter sp. W0014]
MIDIDKKIKDIKNTKENQANENNQELDFKKFYEVEKLDNAFHNPRKIIQKNQSKGKYSFIDLTSFALRGKDLENINFNILLDDFLDEGSISFITSEANKGKTFLSFAICKKLLETNKIRKIIYFDSDNSKMTIKSRIKQTMKIEDFYFLDYPDFNYIQTSNALEIDNQELEIDFNLITNNYLELLVKEQKLDKTFIVFDSLFNFFNGDMNDNKKVAEFMKTIKRISHKGGVTFLFIHHKGKSAESEFMGGVNFLNATDNLFKIHTSNNDGDNLNLTIITKKARNFLPYNLNVSIDLKTLDLQIERAMKENDTDLLLKAKEIIERKGEVLQSDLLELLGKSKTDNRTLKKLENGKGIHYNIIEKQRETGGKPFKYYMSLKESKTIINGVEVEAEQTLFSE